LKLVVLLLINNIIFIDVDIDVIIKCYKCFKKFWGLGIGDWGLGPIPNPQSPLY